VDAARCRTPEILADAAHAELYSGADRYDGRFLIDEEVLREAGITDFSRYAVDPSKEPLLDLFLDETHEASEHAR